MLRFLARAVLPRRHVSQHTMLGRHGVAFDGGRPVIVTWWQWGRLVWAVSEVALP